MQTSQVGVTSVQNPDILCTKMQLSAEYIRKHVGCIKTSEGMFRFRLAGNN